MEELIELLDIELLDPTDNGRNWQEFTQALTNVRTRLYQSTIIDRMNLVYAQLDESIRKPLQKIYQQTPFEYLLIVSRYNYIPASGPWYDENYLAEEAIVTDTSAKTLVTSWLKNAFVNDILREQRFTSTTKTIWKNGKIIHPIRDVEFSPSALDSEFYGNMDEDSEIELMVGRLPFEIAQEIDEYYAGNPLERVHYGPAAIAFYFDDPSVGVWQHEALEDLEVLMEERGFSHNESREDILSNEDILALTSQEPNRVLVSINPIKATLNNLLQNATHIHINTHGMAEGFYLPREKTQPYDVKECLDLSGIPDLRNNRPILLVNACSSASLLGNEFLKKGALVYIGCLHKCTAITAQIVDMPLIVLGNIPGKTTSVGKIYQEALNTSPVRKDLSSQLIIPFKGFSGARMHSIYLGDPSVRIGIPTSE